jgi:hypothetical protein
MFIELITEPSTTREVLQRMALPIGMLGRIAKISTVHLGASQPFAASAT